MNNFKIQTLSNYVRLSDPVTIITAAAAALTQIFPNIFGGNRKRLSDADWNQIIPGNGYWTTALRNYLKTRIHYNTDVQKIVAGTSETYLQAMTKAFHFNNVNNVRTMFPTLTEFYAELKKESAGGGTQTAPPGNIPGVGIGIPTEYLLIGAGVIILMMARKKNRRRK